MGKDVIVACDFASAEATFEFLDKFAGCDRKPFLKIGMELYYAEGPSIVKEIKARGHKIFLDLKLHDIPNTVKKAMAVLSNLDVDITNLHAAGTTAMMKGAISLNLLSILQAPTTSLSLPETVKRFALTKRMRELWVERRAVYAVSSSKTTITLLVLPLLMNPRCL